MAKIFAVAKIVAIPGFVKEIKEKIRKNPRQPGPEGGSAFELKFKKIHNKCGSSVRA